MHLKFEMIKMMNSSLDLITIEKERIRLKVEKESEIKM